MKSVLLIFLIVLLSACANNPDISPEDKSLRTTLVGTWSWSINDPECFESGSVGFKMNGLYTRTQETCHLADDQFGKYRYGWYVADQHICFVSTKKHYEASKVFGYAKEHCTWKVLEYSSTKITVEDTWWDAGTVFNLIKE